MRCSTFREALSARLDGEDTGMPADLLDRHVAGCIDCRSWLEAATALAGAVERTSRDHVPLAPAVLASLVADEGPATRPATGRWRILLACLGVAQLVIASWGPLLDARHPEVHLAHELTAWDVGLAIGFFVAALRPARAWGMLPLAAVMVACLVGASLIDLAAGHALLGREAVHLLEVAGLGGVWMLARQVRPPALVVRAA